MQLVGSLLAAVVLGLVVMLWRLASFLGSAAL
jgi:hypothetical protein